MASLPEWAQVAPGALAPLVGFGFFRRRRVARTRFCGVPKSSMFGEMPLDIRTVVHLAAVAAIAGLLRLPATLPMPERLKVSSWPTVL
jgi:hypothetical protein